jgi:hypothetical protein
MNYTANKTNKTTKLSYESSITNNQSYSLTKSYPIAEFQSISSMQHSIPSITIPKQERFQNSYKKALNDSLYNIPDLRNFRGTSIGYGKKMIIYKTEDSPSPLNYQIPNYIDENLKKHRGANMSPRFHYKVNK